MKTEHKNVLIHSLCWLSLAALLTQFSGCKFGSPTSDSTLRATRSDLVKQARFRMMPAKTGQVNSWDITLPYCWKNEAGSEECLEGWIPPKNKKDMLGDPKRFMKKAIVSWVVRSGNSTEKIDCSAKMDDRENAVINAKLYPIRRIGRSIIAAAKFTMNFNYGERSQRCTDSDRNPDGTYRHGRKLSWKCLSSGDWEGPMRVEACIYSDSTRTKVIGKGWAVPGAGNRRAAEGRGFQQTQNPETNDGGGLIQVNDDTDNAFADINGEIGNDVPDDNDVVHYGKTCAKRLGSLPVFSCVEAGEIIPITKNGVLIPPLEGERPLADFIEQYRTCDKPAYLGLGDQGQCVPNARLGRLKTSNPDVEVVFICRRYKIADCKDGDPSKCSQRGVEDVRFEDVAIVMHDQKTGETCFSQALAGFQPGGNSLSTHRVPPPDEEELPAEIVEANNRPARRGQTRRIAMESREFWISPDDSQSFACSSCHDSDPFMHSPYVDQVRFPDDPTQFMVPCDTLASGQGELEASLCVTPEGKPRGTGKYSMVSKRHRSPALGGVTEAWPDVKWIAPKDQTKDDCVKCHRIGDVAACSTWVGDSVGGSPNSRLSPMVEAAKSDFAKQFPGSHWMPYVKSGLVEDRDRIYPNRRKWEIGMNKHAKAILNCCNLKQTNQMDEFNAQCNTGVIMTRPPATKTAGLRLPDYELPLKIPSFASRGNVIAELVGDVNFSSDSRIDHIEVDFDLEEGAIGDVEIYLIHNKFKEKIFDGSRESDRMTRDGQIIYNAEFIRQHFDSRNNKEKFQRILTNHKVGGRWQIQVFDKGPEDESRIANFAILIEYAE